MAFLKDDDCLLVGRDKKDYRISVKDFANEVGGGGDGDHFSGDYNDLINQPAINNGKLTVKDSDGNSLGEFTANQSGNTAVTIPAASAGVAGPQYTRKDSSWKINYTSNESFRYGHGNGMGKYVDGTVLDIDNSIWAIVDTHDMNKLMSTHNLSCAIGLSWHPDNDLDTIDRNDFRRAFDTPRYVANSITYCPVSKQLMWLQYKIGSSDKQLWSSTYDPSLSTETDTGLSAPVKLKEGNVGITVCAQSNQGDATWHGSDKQVGVWEYGSGKLTLFSIEVGGTLTEVISADVNLGSQVFEVCGLIAKSRYEEKPTWLEGTVYHIDSYTNRHLSVGTLVENGNDKTKLNALDLEIDVNEHPVLASASFATTMMLTFKSFCVINPSNLPNGFLVSRNPNSSSCFHLPKIAKIGDYYICNIASSIQFNFLGRKDYEEELAMTNATPVMSLRTPLGQEAVQVIADWGDGGSGTYRGCYFTSKVEDSEAYESCKPVADESIKDGMIVVDHKLAHGQRYYFAETYNSEVIALSSQCHRA